ncbi:unnamed protein product [Absidia cylindrospora]
MDVSKIFTLCDCFVYNISGQRKVHKRFAPLFVLAAESIFKKSQSPFFSTGVRCEELNIKNRSTPRYSWKNKVPVKPSNRSVKWTTVESPEIERKCILSALKNIATQLLLLSTRKRGGKCFDFGILDFLSPQHSAVAAAAADASAAPPPYHMKDMIWMIQEVPGLYRWTDDVCS